MTDIVLSTTEFEVCWRHLRLGSLPLVLDLPSRGRTPDERDDIVRRAFEGLRLRGLADMRGPSGELSGRLTTLARFAWAVDGRILGSRRLRVRGAATGRHGVIAVHDRDTVTVRDQSPETVIAGVAALMGNAPTTRGEAANVRAASLDAATGKSGGDLAKLAEALVALGERSADARALVRMCQGAHTRGQFGVHVADRGGRPRSAKHVVAFHDTPAGRHLQLRRDGWVTVLPATTEQVVSRIGEVVQETGRG